MTNRSSLIKSLRARVLCGFLFALATAGLTSCHSNNYYAYKFPQYTFANRPIPPSKLAQRVLVAVSTNGTQGSLSILDGLRDIRSNIQNTITSFSISGSVGGFPGTLFNFPSEIHGYVFSPLAGTLSLINYGTEAASAGGGPYPGANSLAIPSGGGHIYTAIESSGVLVITDNTSSAGIYPLNIPNVYQVAANQGDTVVLAMVRNSNAVYRIVKLNVNQYPTSTAAIAGVGAVDCVPLNLPIYCAVPVNTGAATNAFDRPVGVYFSLDGTSAYVLNCGPECSGTTASVTFLQQGALDVNAIPTRIPDTNAFTSNIPVPGGVTAAVSDGTTLYVSGQQLQPDGLFAGNLSTINLTTAATSPSTAVTGKYSISDGTHTKMLFADDNTLWIGSQFCATGERARRSASGITDQTANYNCLTRFDRGALSASIVPAVSQSKSATVIVPYPNTNQNQFYYGDLTGLCWVQTFHKVYTAYGGQVHAFNTADGSEINNVNIIIQGTALDVAYMDAQTDADN